jgi:hypothetical protein
MDKAKIVTISNWELGFAPTTAESNSSRAKTYAKLVLHITPSFSLTSAVESCPRGYPGLAAFLDSDECFSVYRRFGFLQSRLLLDKQDKLRELEEALDKLDKREAKADPRRPTTTDLSRQELEPRRKLLAAIEEHFCSYGKPSCSIPKHN